MEFNMSMVVPATPEELWKTLIDVPSISSCIPGCENVEEITRLDSHLDEIERLIPAYKLDRLNLFAGNDVPTEPGFVPVSAIASATDLVAPAHDGLFTSGELSRYSTYLDELKQHESRELAETAAD